MKRLLLCSVLLWLGASLIAQERGMKQVQLDIDGTATIIYTQSHALVIGVSDYTNGWSDLPEVNNDVETIRSILQKHGFNVTVVRNPNQQQLKSAFDNFISDYSREYNARLLVYFSGHGYTMKQSWGGEMGYIVPADAPNPHSNPEEFKDKAVDMELMEVYAKRMDSKHALFMFDCCFSGSIFSLSKAAPAIINYKTSKPVRQFITAGGADEEVPDKSVFCQQFVSGLNGEGDMNNDGYVTGSELGEYLQTTVVNYTYEAQHPQYGKIRNPNLDKGDFVFELNPSTIINTTVVTPVIKEKRTTETSSSIPQMVFVQGGTFQMGGNDYPAGDEKPVHTVSLSNFYIGKYEVTQEQWRYIMEESPSFFSNCRRCPVENVNQYDIQLFLRRLYEKTGKYYRLPTEAEWEYAARGGQLNKNYRYSGSNAIGDVAYYKYNSRSKTHPVGQQLPNELGIYDMSGNVWEWCSDYYEKKYYKHSPSANPTGPASGDCYSLRGGSWSNNDNYCRITDRNWDYPETRSKFLGFRVCRSE